MKMMQSLFDVMILMCLVQLTQHGLEYEFIGNQVVRIIRPQMLVNTHVRMDMNEMNVERHVRI